VSQNITIPAAIRFQAQKWRMTDARILQRSEFTGGERVLQLGPAARWQCEAEIATFTEADLRAVRLFLGLMSIGDNFCTPTAVTVGQQVGLTGATAIGQVDGAGQLGMTLAIKSLAPSTLHARAGDLIAWVRGPARQMSILTADLTADASGNAVAQLAHPLRSSPADGANVLLNLPGTQMRLMSSLAYDLSLADLRNLPPLMFEERV
jgi:hypothetical protein